MVQIIVSLILLILLAVLVSLNLVFSTSVNLFGARLDNVSVVAVSALSFAFGILYSLFIYLGRYMHRRKTRGLAAKDLDIKEREKQLASRESKVESILEPSSADTESHVPP
ncbi:MAG: LapA family protein, partial [Rectinemataceae bacterium]